MIPGKKIRGIRVGVHWRTADVLDLVMGLINPCLRLSREVHEEVVAGMAAGDVFVDGAAQCADSPF
jgi:hypothetical protein